MNPATVQEKHEETPAGSPALDVARELSRLEAQERASVGLPARRPAHWSEPLPGRFVAADRETTTILLFGLTRNHDHLMGAAIRSNGYRVQVLGVPDNEDHTMGRAYCDRAMCNPTYFTVGHLLRFLCRLRDEEGLTPEQIVSRYVLLTANGCGPCRFTLYINEYRKALRDAGFEGFRVLLCNQSLIDQSNALDAGIKVTARLVFSLARAIIIADVLNVLTWRTRPYELEPGATEAAVARCRERLVAAVERNRGVVAALWRVRSELARVPVDRTRIKPKVNVVGEFWAHITEGDGNYRLHSFLEGEGAEVETQTLIAWLLFLQWEDVYDTLQRAGLGGPQSGPPVVTPVRAWKEVAGVLATSAAVRLGIGIVSRLTGLHGFRIPWGRHLARAAEPYYDLTQRGGEDFLEVAKLLHSVEHRHAHLVVSVKPFGCMPSSAVSDGVQSLVNDRHPEVGFLPVETTGDSAVNVYSRLQMQLFKARRVAQQEAAAALARWRIDEEAVRAYLARRRRLAGALHRSSHRCACTAANLFHEIGRRPGFRLRRWLRALSARAGHLLLFSRP